MYGVSLAADVVAGRDDEFCFAGFGVSTVIGNYAISIQFEDGFADVAYYGVAGDSFTERHTV